MSTRACAAAVLAIAASAPGVVRATQPQPAPAPAPVPSAGASAAPAPGASDPCTSLSNVVTRPTFTTSACTVKRSQLLIEAGYTNATTSGEGANSLVTYPQANLRAGIGRNLEFDFEPTSIARQSGPHVIAGTTDSQIGAKYEIGSTSTFVYGVSAYTLPTGDGPFTGNGDGIVANLNGYYALSPSLSLFGTAGYDEQSAGTASVPARYHDFQPSLGASLSLPQGFDYFVEGFGQSSTGPGLAGRFGVDTGFAKDVGSRLQLDVNYYDYFAAQRGGHAHAIGFGSAYLFGP